MGGARASCHRSHTPPAFGANGSDGGVAEKVTERINYGYCNHSCRGRAMNEEIALVPIEERKVDFYGDEITAVLVEIDGREQISVPVRPISEYLGLAWSAQLQRMRR